MAHLRSSTYALALPFPQARSHSLHLCLCHSLIRVRNRLFTVAHLAARRRGRVDEAHRDCVWPVLLRGGCERYGAIAITPGLANDSPTPAAVSDVTSDCGPLSRWQAACAAMRLRTNRVPRRGPAPRRPARCATTRARSGRPPATFVVGLPRRDPSCLAGWLVTATRRNVASSGGACSPGKLIENVRKTNG